MAKTKISEFSATPGNNTDIDGINIAEGCAPSGINDAIRELMSQLKDFQAGTAGDSFNGPVGTTTAAAGAFTTLTTSSTVTHNGGTANGVAYLNGSKVLTTGSALTFDGTNLGVGTTSPSYKLEVNSVISSVNGSVRGLFYSDSSKLILDTTGSAPISFQLTGSEQMRLTSTGLDVKGKLGVGYSDFSGLPTNGAAFAGSVGIGTSSPSSKLDLVGVMQWQATAGTVLGKLTYSGGEPVVLAPSGLGLQFWTNNSFAAKIDSSGNLGLGVTPSAWSLTNSSALQIRNAGFMGYSNSAYFTANAYNSAGTWKYIASDASGQYAINKNVHEWYIAPSGTAGNAITFTQAMTLDASGNLVGGGKTSAGLTNTGFEFTLDGSLRSTKSSTSTNLATNNGGSLQLTNSSATDGNFSNIGAYNSNGLVVSQIDFINVSHTSRTGAIAFLTHDGSALTERARIDSSGNLLVNKTTASQSTAGTILYGGGSSSAAYFTGTGSMAVYVNRETSDGTVIDIRRAASTVGTISVTTTATAYNTSSDYRLKDNPQPLTGSGAFIDALQPKTWNWKVDGSRGVGFLAHEAQAVSPSSVTGEKDAVDEEGNPIMQAMEYGSAEFIANIIAELQSLRARVAALESN